VSVALNDHEKLKKNLELKKKKPGYNPYADAEALHTGEKRGVLSKYDEEIEGPVKVGFVLGEEESGEGQSEEARRMQISNDMKANAVTLEYEKMQEVKDYYTQEEVVSFMKPKKRKKKVKSRTRDVSELDWPVQQEEEDVIMNGNGDAGGQTSQKSLSKKGPVAEFSKSNKMSNIDDVNFVDDDDLQDMLSRARKLTMKNQSRLKPENILDGSHEFCFSKNDSNILFLYSNERGGTSYHR
jgi:U4/U6.U5 tri-snRNP-associated protein 1